MPDHHQQIIHVYSAIAGGVAFDGAGHALRTPVSNHAQQVVDIHMLIAQWTDGRSRRDISRTKIDAAFERAHINRCTDKARLPLQIAQDCWRKPLNVARVDAR